MLALQAQPTRPGRDVLGARLLLHPRDGAGLGGRFAPLLAAQLRAKRRGTAGTKWHADETYVRVNGRWCYRYRAIDREGNLVDARLSRTRDMDAAQRCFAQALDLRGGRPRAGDDGRARRRPTRHPRGARPRSRPPHQSL
ncbi:MAG: DDE-type integrase/transposase/recombinase [Actinomycetota bacterium]|nr:DDE-type integrase/transposase/recombinase [Actinomycetota bacterium]